MLIRFEGSHKDSPSASRARLDYTGELVSSFSEASARARVGSVLKERWHLDDLLGIGGMACVYAATHRNRNRVAIKLLLPHLSQSANVQRRFLREGYAANSIGHPGAVKVFDDDVTEDGLAFLVMELLEGKTLAALRREAGGRLDPKTVLQHGIGVLDVLAAAHERGVIHRDIKPSNVFVTQDGLVKVVDFGIARICEGSNDVQITQRGALLGSAAFMSPEQAKGAWDLVDARSDIWSFGATLFQLLAGRAVHEGNTPAERIVAAMTMPARSLGTLVPGMPRAVVELVDRALSFEREGRWQSAREMQASMQHALRGLGSLGGTLILAGPPPEISSPHAAPIPESDEVEIRPPPPAETFEPESTPPPARAMPSALGTTARYGSPEAPRPRSDVPPEQPASPSQEPHPPSKVLFESQPTKGAHEARRRRKNNRSSALMMAGVAALGAGLVLLAMAAAILFWR